MSNTLKRNIAANFVGSIVQAVVSLAFIPVYLKFLGIESFGLLGFFATLQAMLALLDIGLSATLTRELARLSILSGKQQEMRNLVRSLELVYWGIALLIGFVIISAASFFANHWVKAGNLSPQVIERTILVMGLAAALQWPSSLYSGGLMGLQRQVRLNSINVGASVFRNAGAAIVLWLASPTIQAFLLWQAIASALATSVLAFSLWQSLPQGQGPASFQKHLLASLWKFAAGMTSISVLAVILTQLDKIILSRMLSLEMFGYYTLASTVAFSLMRLFTPVFYSIYPRFTQLATSGDEDALKVLYHKSSQFMSVLVLPAAIVIAFFSADVLFLWTRNPLLVERAHVLVSVLILGTALNGMMNPPYALQLAYGWTKLNVLSNVLAVVVLAPGIVVLATEYGSLGAASAWLLLNIGYIALIPPVMHHRLLRSELKSWYLRDIAAPFVTAVSVAGLARWALPDTSSPTPMLIQLIVVSMLTLAATLLSVPTMRARLFSALQVLPS